MNKGPCPKDNTESDQNVVKDKPGIIYSQWLLGLQLSVGTP